MIDNIKEVLEKLKIDENDKYHVEMGEWVYNYRNNKNEEDWKLISTLTYNYPYKRDEQPIKMMKLMLNEFINNGYDIEVIYTTETNKNYEIHHHLIMWFSCDIDTAVKLIKKEWRGKGIEKTRIYDKNQGWAWYITKFINAKNSDNWGVY